MATRNVIRNLAPLISFRFRWHLVLLLVLSGCERSPYEALEGDYVQIEYRGALREQGIDGCVKSATSKGVTLDSDGRMVIVAASEIASVTSHGRCAEALEAIKAAQRKIEAEQAAERAAFQEEMRRNAQDRADAAAGAAAGAAAAAATAAADAAAAAATAAMDAAGATGTTSQDAIGAEGKTTQPGD